MRTRRSASSSSDPVSSSPRHKVETGGHQSVLLHEVLHWLELRERDVVVDATLGGGGHAREMLKALGPKGVLIGVDADERALERTRTELSALSSASGAHLHLVNANFRELGRVLGEQGVPAITKALFDLGWSGYQLTEGRGFSFLSDDPLIMTYARYDTADALTAGKIVNTWEEGSIADILHGWGEERYARRIAKRIVEERRKRPIHTARELANIIASAVPRAYAHGKIHPATRTFQALRIAVNDELGALRDGLRAAWERLAPGGRIAVISFHSIEDREVKVLMREWVKEGEGRLLFKSPVTASPEELHSNPRSRSAKLRVVEKLSKNHETKTKQYGDIAT